MSEVVELKQKGLVAELWINREESLNALNYDVIRGLIELVRNMRLHVTSGDGYSETRAVFIRGKGRAFVAGADLKVMDNSSWEETAQFIRLGQRLMREIESLPLPVVAVVDGFALGGGLELALACDLIVLTDKASIGLPETSLGIIPGFGGTQRLAQRVGIGRAKRLIFTGATLKAKEAFEIGVGDWLLESESELEGKLSEIADSITTKGPLAIAAAKRAIAKGVETQILAGLTKEVDEFLDVFNTEDAREGISAFLGKRKADFGGK